MLAKDRVGLVLVLCTSLENRFWDNGDLDQIDKAKCIVVEGEQFGREQDMPVNRKQG